MCAQVDRLFDWRSEKDAPIRESLEAQKPHVAAEFEQRLAASILNLNEQVPPSRCTSQPTTPVLQALNISAANLMLKNSTFSCVTTL